MTTIVPINLLESNLVAEGTITALDTDFIVNGFNPVAGKNYRVEIAYDITASTTHFPRIEVSEDDGATFINAAGSYSTRVVYLTGTNQVASSTYMDICSNYAWITGNGFKVSILLENPMDATYNPTIKTEFQGTYTGDIIVNCLGYQMRKAKSPYDAFRYYLSAGSFSGGYWKVYEEG